jgi:phosphoglycerate dehydrogenase-like enzyme
MRVVVLDDYQNVARGSGPWSQLGDDLDLVVHNGHIEDDDALVELLASAQVVVAMRERTSFSRARLERLPDLRLLVTTGPRNAAIDLDAARERGIQVRGTGGLTAPTVELTWGLILALARSIPAEDRQLRDGGWQHTLGADLEGATLGVAGLGRLGSRVASIGQAFGMRVCAWSQHLDHERARAIGVEPVDRDTLFAQADVLTLHLVLSERTRGLVGAEELRAMKPTALLVNTSRGPLVDEPALLDALRSGTIAGAALDVFDHEPLPADHPLRGLPNVVLTPHLGYVSRGNYAIFYGEVVEDITAWLRGEPLRVL